MSVKQERYDAMYMDIAKRVSEMSWDSDTKVGAIIVKDGNIISMGWNGTPSGFPNDCKHPSTGATLPYVIHAEANAISKLARDGATDWMPHSTVRSRLVWNVLNLSCNLGSGKLWLHKQTKDLWKATEYLMKGA